jgi:hypothetical protein
MLREMRPSEFGMWLALWKLEPWDEQRADLRVGQVALQVSRSWLKKAAFGGEWSINDFLPFRRKPKELSDIEKLRTRFAAKIKRVKKE